MLSRFKTGSILGAALFCSACTVSFNNDLVKSHPEDIEAYTQSIFDAFYAEDTTYLLGEAKDGLGFTEDALIGLYEISHETAKTEQAIIADRGFSQRNTNYYYVSLFHIPRERGRETLRITVTPDEEICCELHGLHLNLQLGENFLMDVQDTSESESTSESQE